MEALVSLLVMVFLLALLCGIVLPIIALVRTSNTRRELQGRIQKLEQAILHGLPRDVVPVQASTPQATELSPGQQKSPEPTIPKPDVPTADVPPVPPRLEQPLISPPPIVAAPPVTAPPVMTPQQVSTRKGEGLESLIGRRAVGWAAVVLILFSVAFFLKYAFENRWIGELGRVAIGMAAGVGLSIAGLHYHRRGWRWFSQMMTAGGIMLLYLSTYGAFGFYHLIDQKTAFPFLAVLVAEAAALAYFYDAPAIAMMALVGGFLAPILLRSDRDQYRALFGYLTALDFGALALLKHWIGLSSIAYGGTTVLFWMWYESNYHPQKLVAVMVFQSAVFLTFFGAQVTRQLIGRSKASIEDLVLMFVNPFAFFATAYHFLDHDHHEWMGVLAVTLALLHAVAARVTLGRGRITRVELMLTIATALVFVTVAIPVQLRSNWITIAWAVEGLLLVWVSYDLKLLNLRGMGLGVLGISLVRMLFFDTALEGRGLFTPVLNRYFLSSVAVSLIVLATASLFRRLGERTIETRGSLAVALVGVAALWFVLTVETYTFFQTQAEAARSPGTATRLFWMGKMAVSVLWSAYAAALAAIGFVRRSSEVRWAALVLFTLTLLKVVLIDMAELKQFYRIIAFLVLGLFLLAVAWGYQRVFQVKERHE